MGCEQFLWTGTVTKVATDGFKFTFDEEFTQNCDDDSDHGCILKVDVNYSKDLHELHNDNPFLPERMKIDKCQKLVGNLYDKENYVTLIRALKQALDHGLILEKVHWVIEFNQQA